MPSPFAPAGPILTVGDDQGRDYATLLRALDGLDTTLVAKTRLIPPDTAGVRVVQERLTEDRYRGLFAEARFIVSSASNG